jgi:hypothetical protein
MAVPIPFEGRKCVKCDAEDCDLAYLDGATTLANIYWVCPAHQREVEAENFEPQFVHRTCRLGTDGSTHDATHVGTRGQVLVASCEEHLDQLD